MTYRLVCLDAGFTLIRPRQTMAERLASVLAEHGHQPDEEEIRLAWDAADTWFWEEYHRPGNATWTSDDSIEQTWRSYHRLMLGRLGFEDRDRDVLEAVLVAQMATEAWEVYEDTMPALQALRAAREASPGRLPGVTVVSDWGSSLVTLLEGLELTGHFDDVLASGAVGFAKPGAEFYSLACSRAGVPPSDAVMIGDSLRADVLGAREAGLAGVLLDRAGTQADAAPDIPVFATLTEAVGFALAP